MAPTLNRWISDMGRKQRVAILLELKRSNGLAVQTARVAGYMGVKQHCVELERDGYLDTWRNPRPVGRPEMLYRLTSKAHEVFSTESHAMMRQSRFSSSKRTLRFKLLDAYPEMAGMERECSSGCFAFQSRARSIAEARCANAPS